MILWIRLRAWRRVGLVVGGTELFVWWAGRHTVPLPSLQGFAAPVPAALLAPLAVAVACAWSLTRCTELESAASRAVRVLDALGILAVAVVVLIAGMAADAVGSTSLGVAAARNTAAYVGLALVGRSLLGAQAGSTLPAGYVLLASLLGHAPDRTTRWWAFALAPGADRFAAVLAVAVFAAGMVLLIGGTDFRRDYQRNAGLRASRSMSSK